MRRHIFIHMFEPVLHTETMCFKPVPAHAAIRYSSSMEGYRNDELVVMCNSGYKATIVDDNFQTISTSLYTSTCNINGEWVPRSDCASKFATRLIYRYS